jgi:hypothetical protein
MRCVLGIVLAVLAISPVLTGCGGGGGGGSSAAGAAPGGTLGDQGGADPPRAYAQVPAVVFVDFYADLSPVASRYGIWVFDQARERIMRAAKSTNPTAKTFLYELVACTDDQNWPNDPIGSAWITQNHPEWYLTDGSGQIIRFKNYPHLMALDPGNADYQNKWAHNAIAAARAVGADGIYIDNANSRYDWNFDPIPTRYPDQASFAAAMDSFMRNVAPLLQQAGLQVVGNGSGETSASGMWAQWNQLLDGRSYEQNPLRADGSPQETDQRWKDILDGVQAFPDKIALMFIPSSKAVGEDLYRYYVASYLAWAGPQTYLGVMDHGVAPSPSDPLRDIRIGSPVEQAHIVTGAVYVREHEGGVVYVNTSRTLSATIEIPAGLTDPEANPIPSGPRVLAAHNALILLKS